ncbi:MAG TPA: hypothetical protein VGE62_03735 [Candidatus Paceibacterota bacterium]
MKKQIKETVYGFILAIVLVGGASFVHAQTWSSSWVPAPSQMPPSNTNIPAPVNTGSAGQTKLGSLKINGSLSVLGTMLFSGPVRIPQNAADGKVLTSDATGVATWQPLPAVCRPI